MYMYRAIRNAEDFFEPLCESLLYGYIIARKVILVNKRSSSKYTQNQFIVLPAKDFRIHRSALVETCEISSYLSRV